MNASLFLSTLRPGIARAMLGADGRWTVADRLPGIDVRCFAADPHHPAVILAGTQGSGLLRSSDYGASWEGAGFDEQTIKSITFSPVQDGLVFAGVKPPGVWRSDDGGETWAECSSFQSIPSLPEWWSPAEPPGTAYVQAITASPADPNVVLAGVEFGAVVYSSDGGDTWTDHRDDAIHDCHTLTFHSSNPKYAYQGGGSGRGGAISRDGGRTWSQPARGLDRHYGWAVAADPADPEVWYVSVSPGPHVAHAIGTANAAIFRSRDRGRWQKLGGGLPDPIPNMPYALRTDPAAPGHLYAGLRNGDIWHSTDHGDSWNQLPIQLGKIDHALLMLTG